MQGDGQTMRPVGAGCSKYGMEHLDGPGFVGDSAGGSRAHRNLAGSGVAVGGGAGHALARAADPVL